MTPDSPAQTPNEPVIRLDAERDVVIELLDAGGEPRVLRMVVARYPRSSLAWAKLADATFDPDRPVESYAYALVGYRRGTEALKEAIDWDDAAAGIPSVPWSHEPNRGYLRSLYALSRAAEALGEAEEAAQYAEFLKRLDPTAAAEIEAARTAPIPVQHPAPPTESIVIRGED
ncbi:DUF3151 family protein [Humibacter ginsenosidimutans]|uniref:DUF3151 family protein n=1 Tax=Humibacter ginsenosidimutans TaxID=2599293 RepID=A0A5B8M4K5_9MICO|nr:DUF3151 family protein [Humibacter ginsenosidimutans]QDZ15263.1 DUF3151 family protein [Humibacter ginsenosidimutans]